LRKVSQNCPAASTRIIGMKLADKFHYHVAPVQAKQAMIDNK
jgi:hypothetical protein